MAKRPKPGSDPPVGWGEFGAAWPTATLAQRIKHTRFVWRCDTKHAAEWAVESEHPLRRVLRCAECGRVRVETRTEGEDWLTDYAAEAR